MSEITLQQNHKPTEFVSILVPVCNEEASQPILIDRLLAVTATIDKKSGSPWSTMAVAIASGS